MDLLLPSRDERRRVRTAREEETRRRQKIAAASKTLTIRDLPSLVRLVVTSREIDPDAAMACLYQEYYYGGVASDDFAGRIFDPALTDLSRLPMGVLDQKEELLPGKYVPDSKEDLSDLALRMITSKRDRNLVDTVAEGWPGGGSGMSRFTAHINNLWQIRSDHRPLYRWLVTGHHRRVTQALRADLIASGDKTMMGDTRDKVISALECQTLLWCAHDVQMILARNAKATSAPLGDLLSSDKTVVEPAAVLRSAREMREALVHLLELYRAHRDAETDQGADNPLVRESGLMRRLRLQVEREAGERGIDPRRAAGKVAVLMESIAKRLEGANDAFLQQLVAPRGTHSGQKSFHPMWFSGLSPLAASSVAILRYQQAEAQVEALIQEVLPVRGNRPLVRRAMALPAFDRRDMPKGWQRRSRDLLQAWRITVLNDKDLHSRARDGDAREELTGKQPINAALAFLDRAGDRQIGDDHGDQYDVRRTFYLLDVLPEHRLTCG
ncbi:MULTISPECIES: hypothetical protein [Sphingomonas]|uniref:Uncharacterized protein n=1 Tax=Sphingomonas sanguinis TaxID=33051 RepID=A0A147J6N4_9SPHN|nr:hypothetical protein [Sphingomonas sanguinis]KTW10431.1 hypothetical protein NS258_12755 [Sphingomonas sanguinis]